MKIRIDNRSKELIYLYEKLRSLKEIHAKAEQPILDEIIRQENLRTPCYLIGYDEWENFEKYMQEDK